MKKLLLILLIVVILVAGYSFNQFLWGNKLSGATTYTIQKGDYLSKIAQSHYGKASYWRELALINRAPESDFIAPGEVIILPSPEVMEKIRRTRWLSRVNTFLLSDDQLLQLLAKSSQTESTLPEQKAYDPNMGNSRNDFAAIGPEPANEAQSPATVAKSDGQSDSSQAPSYQLLFILGGIFIAVLGAFLLFRHRKRAVLQEQDGNGYDQPRKTTEREPDYQEYLRKKKRSAPIVH